MSGNVGVCHDMSCGQIVVILLFCVFITDSTLAGFPGRILWYLCAGQSTEEELLGIVASATRLSITGRETPAALDVIAIRGELRQQGRTTCEEWRDQTGTKRNPGTGRILTRRKVCRKQCLPVR